MSRAALQEGLDLAGLTERLFLLRLSHHRRNWMLLAQACAFNATPICTAYDSLGPDGLAHSLNETEVRGMFTNADLLGTVSKVIDRCKTVQLVVYDGTPDEGILERLRSAREGLMVVSLDEVVRVGREKPLEAKKAKRDDVYCCMYTSGSSRYLISLLPVRADMYSGNTKGCIAHSWQRCFRQ